MEVENLSPSLDTVSFHSQLEKDFKRFLKLIKVALLFLFN